LKKKDPGSQWAWEWFLTERVSGLPPLNQEYPTFSPPETGCLRFPVFFQNSEFSGALLPTPLSILFRCSPFVVPPGDGNSRAALLNSLKFS
jgi:hypothetical protein